jgi:hypothetical protein
MKSIPLLVCIVAACHAPRSGDTLGESVRAYNEGVRWERFSAAAVHVPPAERSQFVDDADQRAKDLRITDYEVIGVEQKGDRLAEVQVKMSWYLDSEGKLRETHAKQTWERHGKTWWIVDEARTRGVEMPGLRETALREAPTEQ